MTVNIFPNIWLGNINDRKNLFFLKTYNINIIIALTNNKINDNYTQFETYINNDYNIKNHEIDKEKINKDMINIYYDVTEFIYKYKNNKNILIYCNDCNQLSPSIIVAYMIRYIKINPSLAIKYIKTKKNNIFLPNVFFISSLEGFNKFLNN